MKRLALTVAAVAALISGGSMLARADELCWRLKDGVITDDETGWKFNVKTDFSYDDGIETFTGLQVTMQYVTKGTGTVVDFRNKRIVDAEGAELTLIAVGNGGFLPGVTELHLPDTVVYLGDNLFNSNWGLLPIVKIVPCLPDSVRYIGACAFNASQNFRGDGTGKLTIGGGGHPLRFAENGSREFFNNKELKQVVLGGGVTNLGVEAFAYCTALTNVTFLAEGLVSLQKLAFDHCGSLAEITPELPKSLTFLGVQAFHWNTSLTSLRLGGSRPFAFENPTKDGRWIFCASKLERVVFGSGVTALPLSPGSPALLEYASGEDSVKDVVFEGDPPENLKTKLFFRNLRDYKHRYTVPRESAPWSAYLADNGYTPWDQAGQDAKDAYAALFGEAEPAPSGTARFKNDKVQFVVLKDSAAPDAKRLDITTSPAGIGIDALTPAYGAHEDVSGELPLVCSVAEGPAYSADGAIAYEPAGYRLHRWNGSAWTQTGGGTATSFTYNPSENGYERLEWQWAIAAYRLQVKVPGDLGEVVCSGAAEHSPGCYAPGSVVTVTATAAGPAPFVRWYGDVPEGQDPTSPTLAVTVDGPMTLVPYFKGDWTFIPRPDYMVHGRITDGYWELNVMRPSVDSKMLYTQNGDSPALLAKIDSRLDDLDLSKPVGGGYTLYGVGKKTFHYCELAATRVILPKTLTEIGSQAFKSYRSLVEIVFNSGPPAIDSNAFELSDGKVWSVPNDGSWEAFLNSPETFTRWADLTPAQKAKWTQGEPHPHGLTVGYNGQWIRRKPGGFVILVK